MTSSTGTWSGPFGYAGGFGYQEDASGLKLLGHRYYDSSTGRFLTGDPAKDGRNWYSYCDGNPMTRTDASGYWQLTLQGQLSIVPGLGSASAGGGIEIGDYGIGGTGSVGIGAGAGISAGPAVDLSYNWEPQDRGTGGSTGWAVGINILIVNFELAIDDKGHASGIGISIGPGEGASAYGERRWTKYSVAPWAYFQDMFPTNTYIAPYTDPSPQLEEGMPRRLGTSPIWN